LNIAIFFHEFTEEETPQNKKPCARWPDAERHAASASGDPAMVSGLGWRPSFRLSHGHLARFAQPAELLPDVLV
jgi:hypothetical protein